MLVDDNVADVVGDDYVLASDGPFDDITGVTGSGDGLPALVLGGGGIVTTTLQDEPIAWYIDGYADIGSGATVTVDPGAVIKSFGAGAGCDQVLANLCVIGTLVAAGSPDQPVVFTSLNDDRDSLPPTATAAAQPGDWGGIEFANTSAADVLSYDVFSYASTAISVGLLADLTVSDSVFSYNPASFNVVSTSQVDPGLDLLPCVPPYLATVTATDDWFGLGGTPGTNISDTNLAGLKIPDEFADLYNSLQLMIDATDFTTPDLTLQDDTVPWSLYTCAALGIGLGPTFPYPPLPVSAVNFGVPGTEPVGVMAAYKEGG